MFAISRFRFSCSSISVLSLASLLLTCGSGCINPDGGGNSENVNAFIGTGGHGHTFPGAAIPNGMVQLSLTPVLRVGMPAVEPSVITGENAAADISGLIGQYAHGNELTEPWFSHADLMAGGTLVLTMGANPPQQ